MSSLVRHAGPPIHHLLEQDRSAATTMASWPGIFEGHRRRVVRVVEVVILLFLLYRLNL